MSDSYQPIYDAVRSRLSNCDIGSAISNVMRECNFSHYFEQAQHSVVGTLAEYERPSVLFKPVLSADGDRWCALYGSNLMEGVYGFGETPDKAMRSFDTNWNNQKLKALSGGSK